MTPCNPRSYTKKFHIRINGRYYQKLATLDFGTGRTCVYNRNGTLIMPSQHTSIWCGIHARKPLYQGLLRSGYQLHMGDETH